VHEHVTTAAYTAAEVITADSVRRDSTRKWNLDARLDRLLTSRLTGIPVMLGMSGFVFLLTITGANVPSAFLAGILMEEGGLSGWLADICAAPEGGLIWLWGAIQVGDISAFYWLREALDPFGRLLGLDGVILIAFIFAIPANEIVVLTIIMGYMQTSRMIEIDNPSMLFIDNGWTLLTAVCLVLFSLLHYPCTTKTLTIWKETRRLKWTVLSNLIPLVLAVGVCFVVAQFGRLLGIV
jgi:Fe2+ transport system protein B